MTAASAGDLGHLDLVHGRTLEALNHLQLRAESVDSSKIENVDASLADYGRALLGVGANASAVSMASATAALTRMISDAETTRVIRPEAILQAHQDLFRHHAEEGHRAGTFRTTQNWIGGSDYSPVGAGHVPPPPETVPGLPRRPVRVRQPRRHAGPGAGRDRARPVRVDPSRSSTATAGSGGR